ncbi:MAG: GFA family protein [Rhodospirillales bacterium]|nr:GFA family protein [Rhodospirillales bacterium]
MDETGGCLCGAVRYRVTMDPMAVSHCHCTFCRRASGAAFLTWMTIPSAGFAYTLGEPAIYGSSPGVERHFCGDCGTSLLFRAEAHPEEVDVTAASLDNPAAVEPVDHVWAGGMLPWFDFSDDGLAKLEQAHWQHGYPKGK